MCGHTLAKNNESGNKSSAFPTEILPGFLWLGSYDNASRSELLKTVGITHILNVSFCTCLRQQVVPIRSNNSTCFADCAYLPKPVQELFSLSHSLNKATGLPRMLLIPRCSNRMVFCCLNLSAELAEVGIHADAVQQEKGRVLVHCMTGTSA